MARLTYARGVVVAVCALSLVASGCGTSQYNALMGRRLASLRGAAKFQGLYAPTVIPDTPFSIRVPMAFERSYQANSAHDDDGGPINPDRLQPPFLKIPGFKLCYEGQAESAGTMLPFYCYLGVVPAQAGDADKLMAQLSGQLAKTFAAPPAPAQEGQPAPPAPKVDEWRTIDADTPDGKSLRWRMLRVDAEQPFLAKTGDKVAPQNVAGTLELWLYDAESHLVIVAWRVPTALNSATEVEITNPLERPAGMKPSLATMPVKTAGTLTQAEPAP